MSARDGGPAFPAAVSEWIDHPVHGRINRAEQGMTLRDWFAGQALTGLLMPLLAASTESLNQAAQHDGFKGTVDEYAAKRAYGIADAMLAHRQKGGA